MPSDAPDPDWSELRPIIDDTIAELAESERGALLLRFFEKKPFVEVGAVLGISEDAARMRIASGPSRINVACESGPFSITP